MILDSFVYGVNVVEIHLIERDGPAGILVVQPRWRGGDPVCGFEYQLDNALGVDLDIAANCGPIKSLAAQPRWGIASGQWKQWERNLNL
ncbi:hypothetical protein [Pelagibius sp. Alg239-R121]|uniref:hypothetical protein n=1 Tax=Pelagibius sp. Alg239-R121 TaxID=2993448 RepID=UPI0024A7984C|nr:hypothetical protein [Pelagibius sp. Alg239-R121]